MQIHHIALRVKDMDASIHFYETLTQLRVRLRMPAAPGEIAYLQDPDGGTELELIAMPDGPTAAAQGMFLCFATKELDAAHARAVAAGMHPSDIRQPEPDARYFYVYDPDGISVQLRVY